MNKKIVVGIIFAIVLFTGAFQAASAQAMTLEQLVNLFISLGIISPDKAVAARAAVSATAPVLPSNSSSVSTPISGTLHHSADTNKDWKISESELSAFLTLYEYRSGTVRTGDYHKNPVTGGEGTYMAGPGAHFGAPHSADANLNWKIDLLELTRVIELKNSLGYRAQAGTEDGFAPITATVPVATLSSHHSADTNRDWRIDESELARVTEIYNYRSGTVRTGEYRDCVPNYPCVRHSADTNNDGRISLLELTRVIELKNSAGYKVQAGTEDGFAPIPRATSTLGVYCVGEAYYKALPQVVWNAVVSGGAGGYTYAWNVYGDVQKYPGGSTQSAMVAADYGSSGTKEVIIRVTDQAGATASASCRTLVGEVGSQSMRVTYPTVGLSFAAGGTIEIAFTNPTFGHQYRVSIRGRAYEESLGTVNPAYATDQIKTSFTLPVSIPAGSYNIVVYGYATEIYSPAFNVTNSSLQPSITVTSPNGGETWQVGTTHSINWTSSNAARAYLALTSYSGGPEVVRNLVSLNSNPGQASWAIPTYITPGQYFLKAGICSTNESDCSGSHYSPSLSVTDYSNSAFTIQANEGMDKLDEPALSRSSWYSNDFSTWPTVSTASSINSNQAMRVKGINGTQYFEGGRGVSSGRLTSSPPAGTTQLIVYIYDFAQNTYATAEKTVSVSVTSAPVTAASCTDSDGGVNINVAGITDGRVNGVGSIFTDSSVGSNGASCSGEACTGVAEGYCLNNVVTNAVYQCSSGYSVNGACATRPVAAISSPTLSTSSWYADDSSTWPTVSTASSLNSNQAVRVKGTNGTQYLELARGVNSGKLTSSPVAGTTQLIVYVYDYSANTYAVAERTVGVSVTTKPVTNPVTAAYISLSSYCVVPGTNVVVTAYVSGGAVTSRVLEKDTNRDGVYGQAASWGAGTGNSSFTTTEPSSYTGTIDFKLIVNGALWDTKNARVNQDCAPQPQPQPEPEPVYDYGVYEEQTFLGGGQTANVMFSIEALVNLINSLR